MSEEQRVEHSDNYYSRTSATENERRRLDLPLHETYAARSGPRGASWVQDGLANLLPNDIGATAQGRVVLSPAQMSVTRPSITRLRG